MPSPRTAAAVSALAAAAMLILPGTAAAQDLYNCEDFEYQEDAQAVLDLDRSDPHRLDAWRGRGDGIACENLPRRSRTATTVTTVTIAVTPTPTAAAAAKIDVGATTATTHTSTAAATSAASTPGTSAGTTSAATTTTSAAPTTTPVDDQDCIDFPSQAAAQAALVADPTDPDRLDADRDGVACEEHFGTESQQVKVLPVGGVDTGGWSTGA